MSRLALRTKRRGAIVAAVVIMLAMLHVVVIGVVFSGGDESQVAVLRVETARAFYAAESGARVLVRTLHDDGELPGEGDELGLDESVVRFVSIPDGAGEYVVEGVSGFGRRRVSLEVE